MTPTKEQIDEALFVADGSWATWPEETLAIAYRAKCAEVEELRKALEPFAEAHKYLDPDYFTYSASTRAIHDLNQLIPHRRSLEDTLNCGDFARARKALEGKE